MKTKVQLLGVNNRPVDGIPRWFYIYFVEAGNGLVDTVEDEDYIEDGTYDLDIWQDQDQEDENENDLLGSAPSQREGSTTKREICEVVARMWA